MFPFWLTLVIIFYFLSGYWLWILVNIFYCCNYVIMINYYSLNTIESWLVNRKIIEIYCWSFNGPELGGLESMIRK